MEKRKVVVLSGIALIFLIMLLILVSIINIGKTKFRTDYHNINLDGINKLMIVAHPDDEILWGGTRLIQEKFLVVCITCGVNQTRVLEFKNVMKETDDAYIMLSYPDKTRGERDNWETVKEDLIHDLENIYNLKNWKEVITHNPEGEYGHIHHKMTSNFVTNIVDKNKLKYFGKYYSKKRLEEEGIILPKMSDKLLNDKKKILELYISQESTINNFSHMFATENILTYNEWMARNK